MDVSVPHRVLRGGVPLLRGLSPPHHGRYFIDGHAVAVAIGTSKAVPRLRVSLLSGLVEPLYALLLVFA